MRRCSVSAVSRAGGADRPNEGEEMTGDFPRLPRSGDSRDARPSTPLGELAPEVAACKCPPPPQPSRRDIIRFRTYIASGLAALASGTSDHASYSAPTFFS